MVAYKICKPEQLSCGLAYALFDELVSFPFLPAEWSMCAGQDATQCIPIRLTGTVEALLFGKRGAMGRWCGKLMSVPVSFDVALVVRSRLGWLTMRVHWRETLES